MDTSGDLPVGARIARARKRRGLTQSGLSQRTAYSRPYIALVETGRKPARPAFIAAMAAALGVDPAELYGQPYRGEGPRDDRVHAAVPDIRRVLAYADIGPDLDGPPRPLDELAAEVATARKLLLRTQFVRLGARLPAVLEELAHHAHTDDSPRAWALLNKAYSAAVSLTRRLGYTDLATALLTQAADAARRAQDPHLPLLVALPRSLILMGLGQDAPALALLERAAASIDPDRPDAAKVTGGLHLRMAIVAARGGDAAGAWEHMDQAAAAVRGRVTALHELQVTPANVAVHGAATAVELGDLDEAARRDHAIGERTLAGLVPERRAHHEIDMSRVHAETGDHATALRRVLSAERIAPQMTRHHPSARIVVRHLVDVRRSLPEDLRGVYARMHP